MRILYKYFYIDPIQRSNVNNEHQWEVECKNCKTSTTGKYSVTIKIVIVKILIIQF